MNNFVINVDWLQLNCLGSLTARALEYLELQKYSTQVFKKVYIYKEGAAEICTIACEPASSILDPRTHLIKFHNRWLYSSDLVAKVKYLIKIFGLEIHSISRLDICADFNNFKNNINPENLIYNFLTNRYLAVGHKKFKVHGKARNKADIQYLRFGGNDSEVSVYLYNKTAELQEVKDKPWIRDFWAANEIDQTKTIWRLEFSIKGSRLRHVDNSTGLIDKFTIDSIDDYSFMIKFYYALLKRYFKFRINDGLSNISRMKQIELFAESSIDNSIKIWNENFESDRSTKIFIKKIESFNNTIRQIKRQLNDNQLDSWFIGDQYMNQVLDLYDKHDFYERKIKEKV